MKRIDIQGERSDHCFFREAALRLGIAEFDVVQVYRAGRATAGRRQLYRGCEYAVDLVPSLRLEFVLFDDDVQTTLHDLLELVHPESIAIFTLNQIISPARCDAEDPRLLRHNETASTVYCASDSLREKSDWGSYIRFRGFASERS